MFCIFGLLLRRKNAFSQTSFYSRVNAPERIIESETEKERKRERERERDSRQTPKGKFKARHQSIVQKDDFPVQFIRHNSVLSLLFLLSLSFSYLSVLAFVFIFKKPIPLRVGGTPTHTNTEREN
jgi:hypothetical protein